MRKSVGHDIKSMLKAHFELLSRLKKTGFSHAVPYGADTQAGGKPFVMTVPFSHAGLSLTMILQVVIVPYLQKS